MTSIQIKTPEYLDIVHFLSSEDLKAYFNKIKIFKQFYPTIIKCAGNISVEYEFHQFKHIRDDEYQQYCKTLDTKCKIYIGNKENNLTNGYMYGFEVTDNKNLDDIDFNFIKEQKTDEKLELY